MKKILLILSLIFAFYTPSQVVWASNSSAKADEIKITVNINTASAEELSTLLKGVGLSKAKAIVTYRQANGPFKSKDDLTKVKGIGKSTVKKNEERILL